ncbi:hypothetical protein GXW84_02875 [Rhodococcus sp. IEGM 248]|uniref:hypothetical protein n=1 Tax=Rhodococcus opacus TaxID=37919 RepID=UPI0013C1740F|nr:hypothetical protein [Rhodococcus opacus]MDV7083435.1 hypothetical protein [Rhodococcus opacus]NDV03481.1 hypothetical protein [Rhodococcus sp. IEGM 248]
MSDLLTAERLDTRAPELTRYYDVAALASAVAGLTSLAPLPSSVSSVLLTVFVLLGPGLAIVTWMRIPVAASVAALPVLGLSVVTAATTVLAWFYRWPATGLLLVMVLAVVASALRHRWHDTGAEPVRAVTVQQVSLRLSQWWHAARRNRPLILVAVALALWVVVLFGLGSTAYSQFGLLFVGSGPGLVVCALMMLGAFVWALRKRAVGTAAAAVLGVIAVERLTPTLITDVPIYGWTYKHLGVVDYIQQFQTLPPKGVDIYGEWPGFFTAFAWFGDITSADMMSIAHWFAPVIHVLLAVVIAAIARLLGFGMRVALTAAMVAELANWVGQDYFSPQAIALVMALGVVALLVVSTEHRSAAYLSILVFAALVPTHQLTPYWLFGVTVALAVTRKIRPWWIPVPYFAILVAYLVPRLDIVAPYGLLSGFNPVDNAASNVTAVGTFGKIFTSAVCRSLSAGIILLAVVCAIVLWRRKRPAWVATVMAFSSFALLAGQSYGGEAIFRVYLYAVPGCAILIAPILVDALTTRFRSGLLRRVVPVGLASGLAYVTFAGLQGYFGLWSLVIGYQSQVTFAEDILANEKPPATIMSLYPAGLPTRVSADYITFAVVDKDFDQPLLALPPAVLEGFPHGGQIEMLTADAAERDGDTYLVFNTQGTAAIRYYGNLPDGSVENFEDQMRSSPDWSVYAQDDNSTIFRYTGPRR